MTTPPLTIRLFGALQIKLDGQALPRMRTRSVEWLLALLTLRHGRTVEREWLAGTLWLDSDRTQALRNLRNNLTYLRNALGKEGGRILAPSRDTLMLDLNGADVDLVCFDQGIESDDENVLKAAADAYTAPLLEGCYEEWTYLERETRAAQLLVGLERLAEMAAGRSDYAEAIALLKRAEHFDPLRDSTARRLMKNLEASGDPASALDVYRRLRNRLQEEIVASPDAETTELFEQIRSRARQRVASPPSPNVHASAEDRRLQGVPTASVRRPPHPLTAIIGREDLVRDIASRIANTRLVTLVGAGGVGKTRLAVEIARAVEADFVDGAAFVELAPLSDGSLILSHVASALGIREEDAASDPGLLLANLTSWLALHKVLLVLDNCEHLIEPVAAQVQALLERCPDLRVLSTSRQRLGVAGEVVCRVPSLPFPKENETTNPVENYPAVRLFLDRAAMADPAFRLKGPEDEQAISQICRRLDGIPLAIELAAARVSMMAVGHIASRLDDRFRLLMGGSRTSLPRHQTLRALIDWSYDQLPEGEQAAIRSLSVFAGGWDLEAAEAMGAELDLVGSLVDKSLVVVESRESGVRYRMLESIREYADEKLSQIGEDDAARDRHLSYHLRVAESLGPELRGSQPQDALTAFDSEIGNIRAAMVWAQSERSSPSDASIRLGAALWPYWEMRGPVGEGREFLQSALNRAETAEHPLRAHALLGVAALAFVQKETEAALTWAEESVRQFRLTHDPRGLAAALILWGHAYLESDTRAEAESRLDEALDLSRQCGWLGGCALALTHLGLSAKTQGELEEARSLLEQAVEFAEKAGHPPTLALALHNLGYLAQDTQDYELASRLMRRSLAIWRQLEHRHRASLTLRHLGIIARRQGNSEDALSYFEEAIAVSREQGSTFHLAFVLMEAGSCRYQRGDYEDARFAFEEAHELFKQTGDEWGIHGAKANLGSTLFHLGEIAKSKDLHRESLRHYKGLGNLEGTVWCLERLAIAESKGPHANQAARLLGAASIARQSLGRDPDPWERADLDESAAQVCEKLGESRFNEAWQEGREMTLDEAVESAQT